MKTNAKQEDQFQLERRNNARAAIRLLVALYLAYIIYQLIQGYLSGDAGVSLPFFIASVAAFSVAEVALLVFSVRKWRQGKQRVDQAWEDAKNAPDQPEEAGEDL